MASPIVSLTAAACLLVAACGGERPNAAPQAGMPMAGMRGDAPTLATPPTDPRAARVTVLVLAATLALGLWIGVAARTRLKAVGVAVAVWFVLVIGVDLVAIGALAVLPPGKAGPWLSVLLMASPIDSARALGLSLFHADVVAGPTGAALRAVLGKGGAWALTAALIGWTLVPLTLAGRRFSRSDL